MKNNAKKPDSKSAMALGRKLWKIGLAARVKAEGYNRRAKWEILSESQHKGWEAIAKYVIEMMTKRD